MNAFFKILFTLSCVAILSCDGRGIENLKSKLIDTRIIGGAEVPEGDLPYQVSIQTTFGEHVCGGAIVAPQWILTAAHCLEWPIQYLKVATGTVNWTKPEAEYQVTDAKVHCLHDNPMYHNDIAMIRLDRPIDYNKHTQPIQLAYSNTLKKGDKLTLSGWGSTKVWGRYPNILSKVQLSYMEHDECLQQVKNTAWLGAGHICTDSSSGQGSCHGDSGGPLVDKNNVLVGIVNWGEPCAVGRPDVYASVAYYHDWIRGILEGGSVC